MQHPYMFLKSILVPVAQFVFMVNLAGATDFGGPSETITSGAIDDGLDGKDNAGDSPPTTLTLN